MKTVAAFCALSLLEQGELIFTDAATEAHIRVTIIDNDEFDESGRAFRIVLTEPSEATKLAHSVATISIIEDDGEMHMDAN